LQGLYSQNLSFLEFHPKECLFFQKSGVFCEVYEIRFAHNVNYLEVPSQSTFEMIYRASDAYPHCGKHGDHRDKAENVANVAAMGHQLAWPY
jgi:hypothetical protein